MVKGRISSNDHSAAALPPYLPWVCVATSADIRAPAPGRCIPRRAYRFSGCLGDREPACGDWKYVDTPVNASWYPTPTNASWVAPETEEALSQLTEYKRLVWPGQQWGGPASQPHGRGLQRPPFTVSRTVGLFNLSADPGEHVDLRLVFPGVAAALVTRLEALEAVAMAPCNIPGGSCQKQDWAGARSARRANAWVPWVKDEL